MAKAAQRATGAYWYTPVADRALPKEEQSRFKLEPLSMLERMGGYDRLHPAEIHPDGSRTQLDRTWSVCYELVLARLRDVENFPAGSAQPWPGNGTRDQKEAYLALMDEVLIYELGTQLLYGGDAGEPTPAPVAPVETGAERGA